MQYFKVLLVHLILIPSIIAGQLMKDVKDDLATTELAISATNLSMPTTEEDWSPFPPGDILNNPWLRKIRFCVVLCFNETTLQAIRNAWPYLHPRSIKIADNLTYHLTRPLRKSREIAVNPNLRSKLYCFIIGYPIYGASSLTCFPGNSTYFSDKWKHTPLGMLRDNIPLSVFNATLAFLSLLLGILGNILIVVSILTKKELKSSTNLLLAGMAVADCLNSITVVFHGYLNTFLWSITDPILGPVGCAVMYCLRELSQLAAVNHLITLSFERCFAICWPMKTSLKFTTKKTILMIIINWLIAAVQLTPYASLIPKWDDEHVPDYLCSGRCPSLAWLYPLLNLAIYLVLPLPILCINYICVVRSLFTSIKRSRQMTGDSSGQTKAEKARLKLVYMMITLVAIYVLTVAPGRILSALVKLRIIYYQAQYMNKVAGAIDLLRAMNSCINVMVYAIISRQFRAAFKEVLCHCCRIPSSANSVSGNREVQNPSAGIMENQV